MDFSEVLKSLKRRLKPFSGVDSVLDITREREIQRVPRGVSEKFDCTKKVRSSLKRTTLDERGKAERIDITSCWRLYWQISWYHVSIVYLIDYCIIKLISLSGALDFLSALYDIPNKMDALSGSNRSPGRRGTFSKKESSPICVISRFVADPVLYFQDLMFY